MAKSLLAVITSAIIDAKDSPLLPLAPLNIRNLPLDTAELTQAANASSGDWSKAIIDEWLAQLLTLAGNAIGAAETILIRALQLHYPRLAEGLTLAGVIVYNYVGDDVESLRFDRDKLFKLINQPPLLFPTVTDKFDSLNDFKLMQVYLALWTSAPRALLDAEYRQAGFASLPSAEPPNAAQQALLSLVNSPVNVNLPPEPVDLSTLEAFVAYLQGQPPVPANKSQVSFDYTGIEPPPAFPSGMSLDLSISPDHAAKELAFAPNWNLRVRLLAGQNSARLAYNGAWSALPADSSPDLLDVRLSAAASPALLAGDPDGARLEVGNIALTFTLKSQAPFFILSGSIDRLALVISHPVLKFFGATPDLLRFEADIDADYIQGVGLRAAGGSSLALGLEVVKVIDKQIGILRFEQLRARLEINAQFEMWAILQFTASAQFGPVSATIEGGGVRFGRSSTGETARIELPSGIGITVKAGPITGGGFLSIVSKPNDSLRFSGAIQLKLLWLNVSAFAIFEETQTDAISFVAVLGIRFPGGIQLSFGFMITGVGGLIGINRRANTDLLANRLASGAAGNVLFAEDPVRNAPRILGDLAAFFPPNDGTYIVGPTLQLSWLYIVRVDVGVLIQFPEPLQIAIVGSARVMIGFSEDTALVYLRIDFIGYLNLDKRILEFRAALVNSHVLGILQLSGEAAFRFCYGANAYVALSVGGFHPRFDPSTVELPRLARVAASLSFDVVVANIWLRQEFYFAITSNTIQLGGRIEAGLSIGPFDAHGFFEIDAYIQFRPFYFEMAFNGGFDIEFAGISFINTRVEGRISGPGPVVIYAKASVKRIVRISKSATFRIGRGSADAIAPISSAVPELLKEFQQPANLRPDGVDSLVSFVSPLEDAPICPVGTLVWEQKKAPLEIAIERFASVPLSRAQKLIVTSDLAYTTEKDLFGSGTYLKLNESQALNNRAFDELPSGVRLRANSGGSARGEKTYEIKMHRVKLPRLTRALLFTFVLNQSYLSAAMVGMMAESGQTPPMRAGDPVVRVGQEAWTTRNAGGAVVASGQSSMQAFQRTRYDDRGKPATSGTTSTPSAYQPVALGAF
ncbi:MAG: hypothetical protein IT319_07335 [Anaerolineae bacterium]|nr:hypothetical protein [Anaerolineae bacterium]